MSLIGQIINIEDDSNYLVVDSLLKEDKQFLYLVSPKCSSDTLLVEIKEDKIIKLINEKQILTLLKEFAKN